MSLQNNLYIYKYTVIEKNSTTKCLFLIKFQKKKTNFDKINFYLYLI